MNNTAIIILAAGTSSRYGSIKQLLHFNNKALLQHTIDEAVMCGARPVIVVTGSHADEIVAHIEHQQAALVYNEKWEEGMASSIAASVQTVATSYRSIDKVIIAVSDQPFVTASLFEQLYQKQIDNACNIVACTYGDTVGTPVLFSKKYFEKLITLQGDEGAKKIVKENKADVCTVDFPEGNIDIDTQEDYQNLLDRQKHVL